MIVKMYRVEGMNCDGCVATVKTALKKLPEVIETQVQLKEPEAIISMHTDIPQEKLQDALAAVGGYTITEFADDVDTKKKSGRKEKKTLQKTLGFLSHKKECCK